MSLLVSSWSKNVQSVPANYFVPKDEIQGDIAAPVCKAIPVIDLANVDRDEIIQQIMRVTQDHGMFQVINHGVSEELMDDAMSLFKEFFDMPAEDKAMYYSEDQTKAFRLYTSGVNFVKDGINCWRDVIKHACSPLEDHIQTWPEKPARYRGVVGTYSVEMRKLTMRILDLICEGLGAELGYFEDELSYRQILGVNHYPPCPDPSLVLGLGGHCDQALITLLQQEVYGLQVFKDGEWVGVDPLPHAFVINVANQLEIISNGKLKSALHRVVTNTSVPRTSLITVITPSPECIIEPAKLLVSASNPPLFKAFRYKDYNEIYTSKTHHGTTLESLKLKL